MGKPYQVYVLKNNSERSYIGLSEDLQARLLQHNAGESKWTSKYRPWRIHWKSRTMVLSDARRLENVLKRQKGGKGLDTLLNQYGS